MDTAISGVSVYYGYTTIITGDNRYIVVPQAASSGNPLFCKGLPFSLQRKEAITTKMKYMEIVSIERKTFEAMVAKFDRFVRRMDAICQRHGEKIMGEWMDNQDVCRMLNISPRTLQTLRDNGTLAYSQINHKTYYRPEDVQRIISVVEDRRKEAKFKGRTI
jgi:hypothetical protein